MTDLKNTTASYQTCKSCRNKGSGNYCSICGQSYSIKRITFNGLFHDVFHFFTHLEKGFGYTLKQLILAPGTMQRQYIEGTRAKFQKPISMFLVSATICALSRYWIYEILLKYYHTGTEAETGFIHQYMVLLYIVLMPLIALLTWLFFFGSGYNYAESGVLQLYNFSFFFLAVIPISLLKFLWDQLDTAYIEFPILIVYNSITFIHFYQKANSWTVFFKSIMLMLLVFVIMQKMEDLAIEFLHHLD